MLLSLTNYCSPGQWVWWPLLIHGNDIYFVFFIIIWRLWSLPRLDASIDICDIYAFQKPEDTKRPFSFFVNPVAPIYSVSFSPDDVYEMKVDMNRDTVADLAYRFTFSHKVNGLQNQQFDASTENRQKVTATMVMSFSRMSLCLLGTLKSLSRLSRIAQKRKSSLQGYVTILFSSILRAWKMILSLQGRIHFWQEYI